MDTRAHWDHVYTAKGEHEVSWFETLPSESIRMLQAAGLTSDSCVIDIGGGDSRLVDQLVSKGLTCIALLDVSRAALQRAQARLGDGMSIKVVLEVPKDLGTSRSRPAKAHQGTANG